MGNRRVQVPSTIDGLSTLKDGGMSVRLHTQELTNEEKITLMSFQGSFGYFLFAEQEFDDEETKQLQEIRKETGGKTPSSRLRAVLFKLYLLTDKSVSFDTYYVRRMEEILNSLKERLN